MDITTLISLAEKKVDLGGSAPAVEAVDRDILRRLAGRVAELAARPIENEKRTLWSRHNALEPTRPLIICEPENGWREIILPDQLECTGGLARGWEAFLRMQIFRGESMVDDWLIEPRFPVMTLYTESDWGVHETITGYTASGEVAYTWEPALKSFADVGRLHYPRITVDRATTEAVFSLAKELFEDILEVELIGYTAWPFGLTLFLSKLRGLEQMMLDIFAHPEELHQLMAFLRDATLAKFDFLEESGLLSLNNESSVGSGGFGYTDELPQDDFDGTHVRTRDLWGAFESQETVGWSPSHFEEFVFAYQLPLLERFGLNCYGCCEPLNDRWHVIKHAPRLRRVSVSPFADWEDMAVKLGDRYIYSLKPHPADLAVPALDEDRVRSKLRRAIEITKGCRVEIIMKDNHTIGNNLENVIRWCQIAREEAEAV